MQRSAYEKVLEKVINNISMIDMRFEVNSSASFGGILDLLAAKTTKPLYITLNLYVIIPLTVAINIEETFYEFESQKDKCDVRHTF